MKYFLLAGEVSGDIYGSHLMAQLKKVDTDAKFGFMGGPKMLTQSPKQVLSIEQTNFMGFKEVIQNLSTIKKNFDRLKQAILKIQPDVIIFIDYPGFNLRMAQWAKKHNFKCVYYISPQLWAWKKNRYNIIKACIDLFFVVLPFEKPFFDNLGVDAIYHGHPMIERIPHTPRTHNNKLSRIGLWPGSRMQEIKHHLPIFVLIAKKFPEITFEISKVENIPTDIYQNFIKDSNNIRLSSGSNYALMRTVDLAIASSGTATLELALHTTPMIVVYKTGFINYTIGKWLVNLPFISLVNLIVGKKTVEERIQMAFNVSEIAELIHKFQSKSTREVLSNKLYEIRSLLGDGQVSKKIASDIYNYFNDQL